MGVRWSKGQGYEGVLLLVSSDVSGAGGQGYEGEVSIMIDDAGVDQWKREASAMASSGK